MVDYVNVCQVPIATTLVLPCDIVANHVALLELSLIEHLCIHVKETPVFEREVGNGIATVRDPSLEVRTASVLLIKPHCEFGISDPRRAIVVKMGHFVPIRHQMGDSVSGDGCAQAVSSDAESSHFYYRLL